MNSEEEDVLDEYVEEQIFYKLYSFPFFMSLLRETFLKDLSKHPYLALKAYNKFWKLTYT